jgi:hypothetical protein
MSEFAHMSDAGLAKAIEEGWRHHWGQPSNSLACRLHRMEDELSDRQARAARDEFRKVATTTPTEDFPGGVSAGEY